MPYHMRERKENLINKTDDDDDNDDDALEEYVRLSVRRFLNIN